MDRLVFDGTLERIHLKINEKESKIIHYGNRLTRLTQIQNKTTKMWIQLDWNPGHSHATRTTFNFNVSGRYYRKIHYMTRKFHSKFHVRNRYPTNREAMNGISVFQVNLTWNSRVRLWICLESLGLLFTWRKPRFTYACVNVREMFSRSRKAIGLWFCFWPLGRRQWSWKHD